MITRVVIENFKRFPRIDVELGELVALIGPNNSGKTSLLQALSLWQLGVTRWVEKRGDAKSQAKERTGVVINRKDIAAVPVPTGRALWRELDVRQSERSNGEQKTKNVKISIHVYGITDGSHWDCGMEFDYQNEESIYVRPIINQEGIGVVSEHAKKVRAAFLPPMSGIASEEFVKQDGEVRLLIGQGQTAQVLRNLCYSLYNSLPHGSQGTMWQRVTEIIKDLFGVELMSPDVNPATSQITLTYRDVGENKPLLDITAAGRGLQQTLLLLTYLYLNPGNVLLLDEPDAHLETLRQRGILDVLSRAAAESRSQIIAASHSEVVLNEVADRGIVISFAGRPHTLAGEKTQLVKSLNAIGWDQYHLAQMNGWVLYLEGPLDLVILRAFARKLGHPASETLSNAFTKYVESNQPRLVSDHFYGLKEAIPQLAGFALFDRLDRPLPQSDSLRQYAWRRREIENYFATREVLLRWASAIPQSLFTQNMRREMEEVIAEIERAQEALGKVPWSPDLKASEEILPPILVGFSKRAPEVPRLSKNRFFELIDFIDPTEIDAEVIEVLDAVQQTAALAVVNGSAF
jgi:energy-coupling factor transporter ATP-binding protein EcfA2